MQSSTSKGSSGTRFLRALVAGVVAAAAGAALYFLVAKLTGYEFGLIAIVVGFAVGTAVRWGSYVRGGWRYQTLAMALTYFAIVSTTIPDIIEGFRAAAAEEASASGVQPVSADAQPTTAAATSATETVQETSLAAGLVGIVALVVLAAALPFLQGIQNIIGIVIIAIGLYEAWKLNKREVLTITGPHSVAARAPAPTAAS